MRKTTSTERMKKLREKLKKNEDKYEKFLENERERDKKRREKKKIETSRSPRLITENRRKEAERKRKYRQKLKEKVKLDVTGSNLGSYKCSQSLGKAVKRVKNVLPYSPSKRSAVIKKLVHDSMPKAAIRSIFPQDKKAVRNVLSENTKLKVVQFYQQDDISRQAPGIKDVKSVKDSETGKRMSVQKRYMNMSVKEAFSLFKSEYSTEKISKSKFYQLRPNNIMLTCEMPHNVCVCKYHANINYIIEAIHRKDPTFPPNNADLLSKICCDIESEVCMTSPCENCISDVCSLIDDEVDLSSKIVWKKWVEHNNRPKVIESEGSFEDAIDELQSQLKQFKVHFFVKRLQSQTLKDIKNTVAEDEAILQVDFAENYLATYQDEIQSAHWSHNQITVFTGCAWLKDNVRSFAVVTDHLSHDKHSVFACLKAIIEKLKQEFEKLTTVKIFSDGCAGQFKNRFTLSNLCFMSEDFGVNGEWHFFATSHGKGAVDGIGGLTKRAVWTQVKQRRVVINTALDFIKCAEKNVPGVNFILLTEDDVNKNVAMLNERWKKVKKIPNIQSHYFFTAHGKDSLITGRTFLKSTLLPTKVFKLSVDEVYSDSSSDRDMLESSSETNSVVGVKPTVDNIKNGTFVLVKFNTARKQSTKYKYAAICLSDIEDDGEVKIMCMRVVKDSGNVFKVDERDISYVDFTQILSVLPEPNIKRVRNSVFYEFRGNVDVFES